MVSHTRTHTHTHRLWEWEEKWLSGVFSLLMSRLLDGLIGFFGKWVFVTTKRIVVKAWDGAVIGAAGAGPPSALQ